MITLASDFGTPYPAAMKGVMLQRTDARLVDVAHDFPRQDVRTAAFWLREVLPYFPPAVHLVVVDPGVGTDRDAVAVRAGDHALVGPDNGVLLPAARALAERARADDGGRDSEGSGRDADGSGRDSEGSGRDADGSGRDADRTGDEIEVFEVEYEDDATESTTFHGRDVFAPAAAEIHETGVESFHERDGVMPAEGFADLRFPEPKIESGTALGEALVVDGFGNVVTNLPGELLDGRESVRIDGESAPVARAYAEVGAGERLVTVGSHGNVELAVNRGRGDEAFGVSAGDDVRVE